MKNILLLTLFVSSVGLQAQTVRMVTNTNDAGSGSLRAAADSAVAGDTIRFSPTLIVLGSDTIVLTTGEIAFGNKGVIIKGLFNVTDSIFISGNNNSRIFSFDGAGRVILDSLVLINGNGTGSGSFTGYGGAVNCINCFDTLFIANTSIKGNTSVYGGGINSFSSISPSSVSIINSIISGNIASTGGGVCSYSTIAYSSITLLNSTLFGNTAGSGLGGGVNSSAYFGGAFVTVINSNISGNTAGLGGGISSQSDSSFVKVISSIISGNYSTSTTGGGGIYSSASSSASSVILLNSSLIGNTAFSGPGGGIHSRSYFSKSFVSVASSTISENTARFGGGIYSNSDSSSSSVMVTSSTISGNTCAGGGGGINSRSFDTSSVVVKNATIAENTTVGSGGGILSSSSFSTITVTSSIIADNNNNNNNNNNNIYNSTIPTIISNGYNIFGDLPTGTIGSDITNVTSAQLNLQALAFKGGFTQTMIPGTGSIALDNGSPTDSSDAQNAPVVGTRDIGAAEGCFSLPSIIFVSQCSMYIVPSGKFRYTQSGVYKDTLITTCGADSIITINLTIPIVDTSVTRNYLTSTAQASNASYRWIDCDNGLIAGETNASFTATANGSYQVEVTQNGCVDTSACFTITNVGVLETELLGISLYPNPTSDVLNIDKGSNTSLEITITNSAGATVYQSTSKSQITTINMAQMTTGMYVVTMKNELGIKIEKVVKR